MDNFDKFFDRLMGNEGGYCDVPGDPGGETKWGISKRSYPDLDIKALTREDAKKIYRRDFWDAGKMDAFDPAIAFQVFDFAVNSSIQTAIRKLQVAISVADDGHFGPISRAKLASMSRTDVIMRFTAQRLRFWAKLSTWPKFGRGWANRAADDLDYAADDT
jgi:lysozyme family protein